MRSTTDKQIELIAILFEQRGVTLREQSKFLAHVLGRKIVNLFACSSTEADTIIEELKNEPY